MSKRCPIQILKKASEQIKRGRNEKLNAVWVETSGCFGEVISLLDGCDPDIVYLLNDVVNITYFGSIMGDEGEVAYERLLDIINKDFILIVSGAISTKDNGKFTTIATYKGERITSMNIIDKLSVNAKHIVSVGTCACYGGPTAAKPNISSAKSISSYLDRSDVIKIPGCPANPVWTFGILGYLVAYGVPELDSEGRPIAFYGETIHDNCPRRRFFDNGEFAKKYGDKECMFLLGCKGPETKSYCPISRWNDSYNWPIGDNTTCIGCASSGFPDKNEPFIQYGGEGL